MSARPLVYMWVVEYSDGTEVSQFDPKTGKENRGDPDWLPSAPGSIRIKAPDLDSLVTRLRKKGVKVKRFGWHNFSLEMAAFLQAHGHKVATTDPPLSVVLDVKEGEQPVICRRNQKKVSIGLRTSQMYDRPIPQVVAVGTGPTVYIVGIEGKTYFFITEDGKVEESSNFEYL